MIYKKRKLLMVCGFLLAVYIIPKTIHLIHSVIRPVRIITSECHSTRLRYENTTTQHHQSCRIHKPNPEACWEANKYFGNPSDKLPLRACNRKPTSDICWFTDTAHPKLQCSAAFCEDSKVYMTRLDSSEGKLREWQPVTFSTDAILEFIKESIKLGQTFCLIKCAGFIQAIIYPPKIILNKDVVNRKKLPNVMIIIIDSISRRHFYRVMRKSIEALKEIANNDDIPADVFDFELFQSVSMHTFDNLRPMFSGVTSGDTNFGKKSSAAQRPIGLAHLFKHYKQHGYQTLVQEDLCWYDQWGIILNNLETSPNSKPSAQRWARFNEIISKHHLDHVGVTHMTCKILKAYNLTTLYDIPPKVCFNGRFINWYFYKYTRSFVNAVKRNGYAAPLIAYHHFNTAHTETGTRIINMDEELASFIHFIARDQNTWTMILSDHGHTRTPFGLTEEGLRERYNPLLFMIVPQNVAQLLGRKTIDNLSTNQKRLLTTLDIHKALMTLHRESNTRSDDFRTFGVFSEIPSSRTCSDLPMMPLARCQCEGSEEMVKDNSPSHTWLAEFALGALNEYIQEQYSNESFKSHGTKGYGRCGRLVGKGFTKVVQSNASSVITFDMHVEATSVGLKNDEVFQVAVRLQDGVPSLVFYDRQTLYNKFKTCVDSSVDIKLCICDKRKHSKHPLRYLDKKRINNPSIHRMFQSEVNVTSIYKDCLFQVIRSHPSGVSVAYEAFNACKDTTFKLEVKGSTYYVFLSRSLPMNFILEPNTARFLFSGARQILNHSHLDIEISVTVVR